jgi:hypothetical protein
MTVLNLESQPSSHLISSLRTLSTRHNVKAIRNSITITKIIFSSQTNIKTSAQHPIHPATVLRIVRPSSVPCRTAPIVIAAHQFLSRLCPLFHFQPGNMAGETSEMEAGLD